MSECRQRRWPGAAAECALKRRAQLRPASPLLAISECKPLQMAT